MAGFPRRENPEPSSVVVLTPYTVQLALIRRTVGSMYCDSCVTVHDSQGREWDIVILSVTENEMASRDVPLTSSETATGLKFINTTVSRAKRRLVLVLDRGFWFDRDGELVDGLLREVSPEGAVSFNRRY